MEIKDIVPVILTVLLTGVSSFLGASFTFVRKVDKLEIMLANLTQQSETQYKDLKGSIQDMRVEIVRLDKELQSVKERLRVLEEKTKTVR
jgi:predicted  nucleic acid-binding Zn-ribbon protein